MSMMKRHMHNCPRAGKSPVRARAELVIKRQPGWSHQGNHILSGAVPFILLIPVSRVASTDDRAARLPQPLMSLVGNVNSGTPGAQRSGWQSEGSLMVGHGAG